MAPGVRLTCPRSTLHARENGDFFAEIRPCYQPCGDFSPEMRNFSRGSLFRASLDARFVLNGIAGMNDHRCPLAEALYDFGFDAVAMTEVMSVVKARASLAPLCNHPIRAWPS